MRRLSRVFSALAAAVRNANIRRLELAWGATVAAEWGHFVALGVFAFEEGGAAAVGIAGLVRLLPAAFLAPFAASLGDRFPRERFLFVLVLVAAAALAGSAAAANAGEPVPVFVLAGVAGLSFTLFRPALQALLPSLTRTPEELIASNGATSTIESIGTLVGPLAAGALISLSGVSLVFAFGAGGLLAGALLLATMKVEGEIRIAAGTGEGGVTRMLLAGLRFVGKAAWARLVVGLIVAQTFVRGCLNVLIVVAVFEVLDGGPAEVGYLTAAIGVGGFVGALWAMALGGRRLAVAFGISLVFWGTPIVLLAPRPDFVAALALLAIVGAANSIEDVAAFTLLQRITPDEMLTRVLGVVWALAMGGVAIGSIAAPLLVSSLGPRAAFAVVGAILPLLTFLTYRKLARLDGAIAPAAGLELVHRIPMFAPLSIAAKERVAASLVPVAVSAGEVVIRAGDPGDRFFIVDEGEFEIEAGDRSKTAGKADYFGEIALLRDVPRTATVKATVDSRLYALQRDHFLAAVTGHPGAHAAGEAIAEARLAGRPEPMGGGR